jgi:branched-chain amino acid transport system substrate-binding protein
MNMEFNDVVQGATGATALPYPVRFSSGEAERFAKIYEELHNETPDSTAQSGYVQTKLMIEAIVRAAEAGEITGDNIAREMHKTDTETLLGRVTFDENGDNPHFIYRIGQHQGDTIELVWPESAATAEMSLPGRPW